MSGKLDQAKVGAENRSNSVTIGHQDNNSKQPEYSFSVEYDDGSTGLNKLVKCCNPYYDFKCAFQTV